MKLKYIFATLILPLLLSCNCNKKGEAVDVSEIKMDTTLVTSVDKIIKNDTLKYTDKKDGYVLSNKSVYIRIKKTKNGRFTYLSFDKAKIYLTKREQKEIRTLSDNYINRLEQIKQDRRRDKLNQYINKK